MIFRILFISSFQPFVNSVRPFSGDSNNDAVRPETKGTSALSFGQTDNTVVRTEAVRAPSVVPGIFFPLSIYQKLVFMIPGRKHHPFIPHPIFIPSHGVFSRTPVVEISRQKDLLGLGRFQ
jgi:hypothetical protein